MLDTMQILLWSVAYVLIIAAGFLSRDTRKVAIPYAASVMNFAWEACALQLTKDFWGHYFWFGLDLFIVGFAFFYLLPAKKADYTHAYIYIYRRFTRSFWCFPGSLFMIRGC